MTNKLELIQGDITKLDIECIVNAANTSLLGGSGVDGAIHRAAGTELLQECRLLGGCKVGEAKITKGYNLKAKNIIHTVGPVYRDNSKNESELLANCYRNSLNIAKENNIKEIAFPCISTGIFRFPFDEACKIALTEIKKFLEINKDFEKVVLVCFSESDFETYAKLIGRYYNE